MVIPVMLTHTGCKAVRLDHDIALAKRIVPLVLTTSPHS